MTYDEIITAMERGETGRELDAEIHADILGGHVKEMSCGGGVLLVISGLQHGISKQALPHYTTSLDASVPGEDIDLSYRDLNMRCHAQQARSLEMGHAPTEALARRIAGLKAWKAAQEAGE